MLPKIKKRNVMITRPVKRATIGDTIRDATIFIMPCTFSAVKPFAITTAPSTPPISACDELLGIPNHQVRRFQNIAPIMAAIIIYSFTIWADLTKSPPMVLATPVLYIAPKKLSPAAIQIAVLGVKALVDTEVAMAFAVSWNPLM
ncbi:hypothetical protein SDC9_91829 [bioreactor metagenome]|uniref:Uncharacterized protein n=1 Tax=bioreactor metagenome TaxID=1076179 RepID=A0A645A2R7_9ZZZZ